MSPDAESTSALTPVVPTSSPTSVGSAATHVPGGTRKNVLELVALSHKVPSGPPKALGWGRFRACGSEPQSPPRAARRAKRRPGRHVLPRSECGVHEFVGRDRVFVRLRLA